jgi:RNA polymerase sigma-70 factor (ECF subfamily)
MTANVDRLIGRDADLVERASHGDASAFEQLLETRVDRVFRMACAILGNEADAHDATQEAFVSAWRNLSRLRDRSKFDPWLNQTVVNRCRDVLRRRNRSREIELDGAALLRDRQTDVDRDRFRVNAAFDRLRVEQRALLVAHHLDHLPVADIARQLGIPEGTAKWRLHAARQALERALETDR